MLFLNDEEILCECGKAIEIIGKRKKMWMFTCGICNWQPFDIVDAIVIEKAYKESLKIRVYLDMREDEQ